MYLAKVGCQGMKRQGERSDGSVGGVVRGGVYCCRNMCVCGYYVGAAGMTEFGFGGWGSRMGCCCRGESRGIVVGARWCRR